MFFFQRNWSPLFFISRSSYFSVSHVNLDINLDIKMEERRTRFCCCGFFFSLPLSLKVQVAMGFTVETLGVLEMQNFTPAYMKGWTYVRTDDFVTTKISWIHRYNLVPRAFPLKNGWGGKRPWHRLVTCTA